MSDVDISRDAVQTALKQFAMQLLSDYEVDAEVPRNDPDFSNCLFAEADAICTIFRAALDAAEARERERCAQIVDAQVGHVLTMQFGRGWCLAPQKDGPWISRKKAAAAIRTGAKP